LNPGANRAGVLAAPALKAAIDQVAKQQAEAKRRADEQRLRRSAPPVESVLQTPAQRHRFGGGGDTIFPA
jgi:hypothetical protein